MNLSDRPDHMLEEIMRLCGDAITSDDVQGVRDVMEGQEWEIALENLCTLIYEHEKDIPQQAYGMIVDLGSYLGIAPRYWEILSDSK